MFSTPAHTPKGRRSALGLENSFIIPTPRQEQPTIFESNSPEDERALGGASALRNLIADKEAELKSLTAQKPKVRQENQKTFAEISSVNQLKAELEFKTKILKNRSSELQNCEDRLHELTNTFETISIECAQTKTANVKLQSTCDQYQRSLASKEERVAELEKQLQQEESKHVEELERLKLERATVLQTERTLAEKKRRDLEEEMKMAATLNASQEATKTRLQNQQQLEDMRKEAIRSEANWKSQTARLIRANEDLEAELTLSKESLKNTQDKWLSLKSTADLLQKKLRETEQAMENVEEGSKMKIEQLELHVQHLEVQGHTGKGVGPTVSHFHAETFILVAHRRTHKRAVWCMQVALSSARNSYLEI